MIQFQCGSVSFLFGQALMFEKKIFWELDAITDREILMVKPLHPSVSISTRPVSHYWLHLPSNEQDSEVSSSAMRLLLSFEVKLWCTFPSPQKTYLSVFLLFNLGTIGSRWNQRMNEAVFLTLGRSRSSHSKKLGLRPNA